MLPDGSVSYTCERTRGHPSGDAFSLLSAPPPRDVPGLTGLAEELELDRELPAALAALGDGWFEYGLVERSYARRQPAGFARMVEQWSHTAIAPKQYTASAYIAGVLGRLARAGDIVYRSAPGTGRWDYNYQISWWAAPPGGRWDQRTSWEDVIGDHDQRSKKADLACRSYVPGA